MANKDIPLIRSWLVFLLSVIICIGSCNGCKVFIKPNASAPGELRNVDYSDICHFRVTQRLGQGTFGEVFLGYNIHNRSPVAVKVYRFAKLSQAKMIKEIEINQLLCHPNIARLLHVVRQELTGYPALIFEYVSAHTLGDYISSLSARKVKWYTWQLLRALAHAHSRGVVHRDLKPVNVVVANATGQLKVIDWGLSAVYTEDDEQVTAGTLHYQAPEVLLGSTQPSPAADMWALGCMFAAMLLGRGVAFHGANVLNQLHTVAKALGTDGLVALARRYALEFNASIIHTALPAVPWQRLCRSAAERARELDRCTPGATDLLSRILRYDPAERLTAAVALQHPYFHEVAAVQ